MNSFPVPLSRALGILLGVVATTMAHGQQAPPARAPERAPLPRAAETPRSSVHRMVIQEGPNRRVHYIGVGNLSTNDRLAAYDLERAENSLTYLHDLQRLKQQYVNSERILEPQRRLVQQQLYGLRIRSGSSSMGYVNYGGYGGYGYPGPYGYNVAYSPYYYGNYGYPGSIYGAIGSSSYMEDRSLQYGVGDEGRMKNALSQVIARDASPEYAASVLRTYDAAAARAAESPVLSRDLGLSKSSSSTPSREPTFTKGSKVTLWAGNDKYVGTVKEDRPGWIVLQTDKGEVTVRKAEITRSEASKP